MKNKNKNQKGQVVLVVMLVSALILTLGLSSAKQATVETRIDSDEALLKQAFNTAESGVDYYLTTSGMQYSGTDLSLGSANVTVNNLGNKNVLSLENVTAEGSPELIWLMGHNPNGSLDTTNYYNGNTLQVCNKSVGISGDFKIDYFYKNNGNSYGVIRDYKNNSSFVNNCATVTLTNKPPVLLVVTPIYFSPKLEIDGVNNNLFPVQGEEISSTGTVDKVNSTVRVLNKYEIPSFMLEAITSSGNISNN
jgi:type II secretory pathway pseudopilin PulG